MFSRRYTLTDGTADEVVLVYDLTPCAHDVTRALVDVTVDPQLRPKKGQTLRQV